MFGVITHFSFWVHGSKSNLIVYTYFNWHLEVLTADSRNYRVLGHRRTSVVLPNRPEDLPSNKMEELWKNPLRAMVG